jgi:hypothetical protein
MNALFKEHGYLDGEPGAYGLTEKGAQYGAEQENWNGYGGYAQRAWTTRTWDDSVVDALRADMAAVSTTSATCPEVIHEEAVDADAGVDGPDLVVLDDDPGLSRPGPSDRQIVAVVGVVVGAIVVRQVAPHVKPFWRDKVKPAADRIRAKLTRSDSLDVVLVDVVQGEVADEPNPEQPERSDGASLAD